MHFSWTDLYYHDNTGKILGEISPMFSNKVKASYNNCFLGWYISEICAKKAVETEHKIKKEV
jgi:hypothetical protein